MLGNDPLLYKVLWFIDEDQKLIPYYCVKDEMLELSEDKTEVHIG